MPLVLNTNIKLALQLPAFLPAKATVQETPDFEPAQKNASQKKCAQLLTSEDQKTSAEILWALKVSDSNYSYASCDNIGEVFQRMFPDSIIAKSFKLGSSKISYIVSDGIGPYLTQQVVRDITEVPETVFTLHFDETSTIQAKKQLDVIVGYFSNSAEHVQVRFLRSIMFGHAFADTVFEEIRTTLCHLKLPMKQLLSISSDGPNVNKSIRRKINRAVEDAGGGGLVDVGFCSIHTVHNSFRKGLEVYGSDCEELALDLYYFFKISSGRREDFNCVQGDLGLEEMFFVRYVECRWLSLLDALRRINDQLGALKKYFQEILPAKSDPVNSTARFKRIASKLRNETLPVQLNFLMSVKPLFDKYLLVFQTEGPLIHCLYPSMMDLIKQVLLRFLDGDVVKGRSGQQLKEIDVSRSHLPQDKMEIGLPTRNAMQQIKSTLVKKETFVAITAFYQKASRYLLDNLPVDSVLLKSLTVLHPDMNQCSNGLVYVRKVAEAMPFVQKVDIATVCDEWNMYTENSCGSDKSYQRIDEYWAQVVSQKSSAGSLKYPKLSRVIKAALSLAHSNADSERGLSVNKRMLGTDRGSLSVDSINGLRACKDAVRASGGCTQVTISRGLLGAAKASYRLYKHKVEYEKKKAEEKRREEEEKQLERQKKEQEEIERAEKLKTLKDQEKSIGVDEKKASEEVSRAKVLLNEAQKRLSESIEKKDMNGIVVASGLLQVAQGKLESSEDCQKKLHERKRKLIQSYQRAAKVSK